MTCGDVGGGNVGWGDSVRGGAGRGGPPAAPTLEGSG